MPEIGFKKGRRKKENKEKKNKSNIYSQSYIYSQKFGTVVDENWNIHDYKQEWIKQAKGNIMVTFFFFFNSFFLFSLQWKPFFKRILWKDLGLDM